MSLEAIREKRNQLETEGSKPIVLKVYNCFLRQPTLIGPNEGNLRPLNFSDLDDRSMFFSAVIKDVQKVRSESSMGDFELINQALDDAGLLLVLP